MNGNNNNNDNPSNISELRNNLTMTFNSFFIANFLIYLSMKIFNMDISNYTICEWTITYKNQFYRILSHHFFHINLIHISVNMLAFYFMCKHLEKKIGTLFLLTYILHSLFLISILYFLNIKLLNSVIISLLKFTEFNFHFDCACGFSGVLFSLYSLICSFKSNANNPLNIFYLVQVKAKFSPYIYLLLIQIINPNGSFLSHLCGIMSSYLIKHAVVYITFPRRSWIVDFEAGNICIVRYLKTRLGYICACDINTEGDDCGEITELDKGISDTSCCAYCKKFIGGKRAEEVKMVAPQNNNQII